MVDGAVQLIMRCPLEIDMHLDVSRGMYTRVGLVWFGFKEV